MAATRLVRGITNYARLRYKAGADSDIMSGEIPRVMCWKRTKNGRHLSIRRHRFTNFI